MSTIESPGEYDAIARLFDLVCEGNGSSSELEQLDSQIAKSMELAYQSAEPAPIAGMEFKRRATSLS
jgi:hypothetical protein